MTLRDKLSRIRRNLLLELSLQGALRFTAWTSAVIFACVIALKLGAPDWFLRLFAWGLLAIAAGATGYKYVYFPRKAFGEDLEAVAKLMEERLALKGNPAVIAIQLERKIPQYSDPITRKLAMQAVQNGFERTSSAETNDIFPLELWKPTGVFLLFAALLIGAIAGTNMPDLKKIVALAASSPFKAETDEAFEFIVGDISVTYKYPAHSGLEVLTVPGSSGDLEALKGTIAEITIRTDKPYSKAYIKLDEGQKIAMTKIAPTSFKGVVSIIKDGGYRFVLGGTKDAVHHTVKAVPDKPPDVKIAAPPMVLEIREGDDVNIVYKLKDDFGLARAELVYEYSDSKGGRQKESRFISSFNDEKEADGSYVWSIAGLTLVPGDKITYWIAAYDNDASDPTKAGKSAVHTLKVFSMRDHHEEALKKQEQLFEKLLKTLADLLEDATPSGQNVSEAIKVEKGVNYYNRDLNATKDISGSVGKLIEHMNEDRLTQIYVIEFMKEMQRAYNFLIKNGERQPIYRYFLQQYDEKSEQFKALKNNPMEMWHMASLAVYEGQIVEQIENDASKLMDMVNKQRYDNLVSMGEDIKKQQEELAKLLDEYKKSGDEALKRKIMEQIDQIKKRIEDLMAKMSQIIKTMPEGFVNMDALRAQAKLDPLNSMENKMKSGDLEGALADMENLAKNLESMLSQMKDGSGMMGENMFGEQMQKISSMMSDLEELEHNQGNVAKKAEEMQKDVTDRMMKKFEEKKKEITNKLLEEIENLRKHTKELKPDAGARSGELMTGLQALPGELKELAKSGDIMMLKDLAKGGEDNAAAAENMVKFDSLNKKQADQNAEHLKSAKESLKKIASIIEEAAPKASQFMTEAEKLEMDRLKKTQGDLMQKASNLSQKIKDLEDEMPMMPQNSSQTMQDAANDMYKAQQSMQNKDSAQASQNSKSAHGKIKGMKDALNKAMQGMKSGMGYAGQRMMPMSGDNRGMSGPGGMKTEKVEIPSADNYVVPKELRDDLLKTMKEASPQKYKQQNKKYYQGLIK